MTPPDRSLHPAARDRHPARSLTGAAPRPARSLAEIGASAVKINHDLRNLLSAALLHAERLEASSDPASRRTGERVAAALLRAEAYTEQILAYARTGTGEPVRGRIELRPLVGEAAALLGLDGSGPVAWAIDIPAGLALEADAAALFRAVLNLLRNAVQAVESGSGDRRVAVTAERRTGLVRILVSDTGPGVPMEMRASLFEPFRTTRARGTGLGLAVVADVARAHCGFVSLLPTEAGATFALDLPETHAGAGCLQLVA